MKIGVIIPDRNDRPELLENCIRMIKNQTLQPDEIKIVNHTPNTNGCDITERYRIGYHAFDGMEFDCLLLMENDDWYHPMYIETMVMKWIEHGKPQIFGTDYTIYYNVNVRGHFTMNHPQRSSAMSTLIIPDLQINWCVDHEPYTDIHLWLKCKLIKKTFKPDFHITIGIKHGIGKTGGYYHTNDLHRYINLDDNCDFLKTHMDNESFKFYHKLCTKPNLQS